MIRYSLAMSFMCYHNDANDISGRPAPISIASIEKCDASASRARIINLKVSCTKISF